MQQQGRRDATEDETGGGRGRRDEQRGASTALRLGRWHFRRGGHGGRDGHGGGFGLGRGFGGGHRRRIRLNRPVGGVDRGQHIGDHQRVLGAGRIGRGGPGRSREHGCQGRAGSVARMTAAVLGGRQVGVADQNHRAQPQVVEGLAQTAHILGRPVAGMGGIELGRAAQMLGGQVDQAEDRRCHQILGAVGLPVVDGDTGGITDRPDESGDRVGMSGRRLTTERGIALVGHVQHRLARDVQGFGRLVGFATAGDDRRDALILGDPQAHPCGHPQYLASVSRARRSHE
ncbi:hypothetical protein C5F51_33375 [Nocardia nova]|uniref:Uncharacterized protein n=1 Tax=Nocardia nova TaxID=37330 RepID=A0A2S5ZW23_9NOCA|nr:hypothetical protein C5F51_33375 [Nocardia nova]